MSLLRVIFFQLGLDSTSHLNLNFLWSGTLADDTSSGSGKSTRSFPTSTRQG